MKEKLNASKFVKGFNPLGFIKTFSIMTKMAIIIGLGYAIYITAIKPHGKNRTPTTIQQAEEITNIDNHPKKRHKIELLWGAIKVW